MNTQKQSSRGVLRKRCSENMQNIYRRTPIRSVISIKLQSWSSIFGNIVNNDYQQDSRVLYTFVPNKSFGQLLDISPKNFIFLKTFNSECSYIEVWFADQNSKPLEIEDKTNITLVIN